MISWLWLIPAFAAGFAGGLWFITYAMMELVMKAQDVRAHGYDHTR